MNERAKELRARLAEVERELAQLKKKRRTLERAYPQDVPEELPVLRRASPTSAVGPDPVRSPPEAGLTQVPEWAVGAGEGERRERFASYFMTGSLGRAAPQLRKERRAMRNKAILMAVAALILLIVLASFLIK